MTKQQLAEFLGRSRLLFQGEIDEVIFDLAKTRIAGLPFERCIHALNEYALQFGGSRGKFIPSKFFEFYAQVGEIERARIVDPSPAVEAYEQSVDADWARVLAQVESLEAEELDEIVATLTRVGWPRPQGTIAQWGKRWLLACADISRSRVVALPTSDGSPRLVSAVDFYASLPPQLHRNEDSDRLSNNLGNY